MIDMSESMKHCEQVAYKVGKKIRIDVIEVTK